MHMFFYTPTSNARAMQKATMYGNAVIENADGVFINMGGVTINGASSGKELTVMVASGTDNKQITMVPIPPNYQKHRWRLIGVGLEVHDTTSQLNKQGALTVYQLPQSNQPFSTLQVFSSAVRRKEDCNEAYAKGRPQGFDHDAA